MLGDNALYLTRRFMFLHSGARLMENDQLIDIQMHCFRLGQLLSELDPYDFISARDWLTIGSGVESVTVRTAKHDETTLYCRGAFEFEEKRSLLLSQCIKSTWI